MSQQEQRRSRPAPGSAMDAAGYGRWVGLSMLSLGVAMIIVDATIVNVAVPTIIRDLHLTGAAPEWVNAIYALVFAALLVTLGRFGDVLGRRAMYLAGLVVFIVASILAGLAGSGEILIGARVLQGVGGAMILPATQSILNASFQGRDRAIAFGIWGAVIGGTAAIGPLIGGWLTTSVSWRWAFFINVPVGIFAILGTRHYIGESRDPDAKPGFDLPGFLLITAGLGLFVFGLIEGNYYGWWAPREPFDLLGLTWPMASISPIPFALAAGAILLPLFLVVEYLRSRAGKFFLFDVTLWSFRAFRYGNLAGTIVSLGEFGLLFVLPLFLQAVIGYNAFETGLVFLSLALGSFLAAPLAVGLARRFGARRAVTTGMGLEAAGILATTLLISRDLNGLVLLVPLFVYGIGVGLATAQLTSIVLSEVPPGRSGLASGTNSTVRQVGSAMGVAILGTVLVVTLGAATRSRVGSLTELPGVPAAVSAAVLPQLQEGLGSAMERSFGQALVALKADPGAALAGADGIPVQARAFLASPAGRAALEPAVVAAEDGFVDAARAAGFVATGFVLLGVVFSLLLPATQHGVQRVAGFDGLVADPAASGPSAG